MTEGVASVELLAIKHNAETGGITAPTDVVQLVDTLLGWRRQAIELGAALAAYRAENERLIAKLMEMNPHDVYGI